jgi:predicted transcriptional regulator
MTIATKKVTVVVPEHAGGRPTHYDPKAHPALAALLASRGATVAEFADAVGVTDRTIRNWFAAHPEFAEAFKVNAANFDERAERALAERAIGYEYDDEEIKVVNGDVLRIPVRRHLPPDDGALKLYLTNRMPSKGLHMAPDSPSGAIPFQFDSCFAGPN